MIEHADLPPAVRLRLYRELAEDARKEADMATGAPRECYLLNAENWEKLAAQLNPRKRERRKNRRGVPDRRKR
jgi:hypothetical protein